MNPLSQKPIIVVSGLPRSGTSLMMQILEKAGLPPLTDQLRTADIDNQQGYYEYEPVKFMKDGDLHWMGLAQGKVIKIISHLLAYLPPKYRYKIVFMQRNLAEVVASQNRMLENKGEAAKSADDGELEQIFAAHIKQIKDWISDQPNIEAVFVEYNLLVQNPAITLKPVETFLTIALTKPQILAIVDTKYYRQKARS
jgi:hypothetical protein